MKKLLKECRYSKPAEREREKKKERGREERDSRREVVQCSGKWGGVFNGSHSQSKQ